MYENDSYTELRELLSLHHLPQPPYKLLILGGVLKDKGWNPTLNKSEQLKQNEKNYS